MQGGRRGRKILSRRVGGIVLGIVFIAGTIFESASQKPGQVNSEITQGRQHQCGGGRLIQIPDDGKVVRNELEHSRSGVDKVQHAQKTREPDRDTFDHASGFVRHDDA